MKIPALRGMIRRRMLVNFRVDPAVMQRQLPAPFRPKTHEGYAIAGICLIRLENIRPLGFPAWLGFSSENAAHRIAVRWNDSSGNSREGVFIPRRDSGSRLNQWTGGRIFSGEHHPARFHVADDGDQINFVMESIDKKARVRLRGHASDDVPASSCFDSLEESSRFFEGGALGYSVTRDSHRLDGLSLKTSEWRVQAFAVEELESSFFADADRFPAGSAVFDHALVMRNIPHEWHLADDLIAGANS